MSATAPVSTNGHISASYSRRFWSGSADCGWRVPRGEACGNGQNGLRVVAVCSGCAVGVKFAG
jgi:hypothetical protein